MREVLIGCEKGPVGLHRWESLRGDVSPFKQSLFSWWNDCTCLPFESNALELSNTILCHVAGLSFLMPPVVAALSVSPNPELGVVRILLWDEAVAELRREITQFLTS